MLKLAVEIPSDKIGHYIWEKKAYFLIFLVLCKMELNPGDVFRNKVRIRVCGVLIESDRILLVKHTGLGPLGYYWSPPGGGVEFGETIEQALKREFREETGLEIDCLEFMAFHEHIDSRFHALELFFRVRRIRGVLQLGTDPELEDRPAMMVDLQAMSLKELSAFPAAAFHPKINHFFSSAV